MIKSNELRLGNWVINDHGETYQIGYGGAIDENGDYEPIPITPEILNELMPKGVIYLNDSWSLSSGIHDIFLDYDTGFSEVSIPIQCQYVHHLQNAVFFMTGIELDFFK